MEVSLDSQSVEGLATGADCSPPSRPSPGISDEGDHIPGIPRHQVKFGGDVALTPKFKLGADVLVAGAQYLVGDDANQNPKLPLYWVANLHASYQMDEHVQFFGLINNIFNNRNATDGTFLWRREGHFLADDRERVWARRIEVGQARGFDFRCAMR